MNTTYAHTPDEVRLAVIDAFYRDPDNEGDFEGPYDPNEDFLISEAAEQIRVSIALENASFRISRWEPIDWDDDKYDELPF